DAVEICKLRLFLKLVAQVEQREAIEPLPDIDFNIRAGNTLVGFASLDAVRDTLIFGRHGQRRMPSDDDLGAVKRVEERAAVCDMAYRRFKAMQTDQGMSSSEFAAAKHEVRARLKELALELDRWLAATYGVDRGDAKAFEHWRETHQPFHWLADFYGSVSSGGFDVIIGNPPYVEYGDVKQTYTLPANRYATEPCGNLYAFMYERSLSLVNGLGRTGLIIPVASVCTDGYSTLQNLFRSQGDCIMANFNDRPSKLFDGLEHIRLSIVLCHRAASRLVFSTGYTKWFADERTQLFERVKLIETTSCPTRGGLPKVGSSLGQSILTKVVQQKACLSDYQTPSGDFSIYYTRKLSHFVQILDFVPRIVANGETRLPSELKQIRVCDNSIGAAFLATLNSSLFFWYITIYSDCRNLNKREVLGFPFDPAAATPSDLQGLSRLSAALSEDLRRNSQLVSMNYRKH
ncbi:MAG: Eco57I restriction-modification methylase domain-containing protein, partial [Chloroflexota bacterium]